jgi:hypothetical protein
MPRWLARILLEIMEIRVERLQNISEADAVAEGCIATRKTLSAEYDYVKSAADSFADSWVQAHGPGSWDANPWVRVIEFRRRAPL